FSLPAFGKTAQGTAKKDEKQVNGAFYHVHWYKYPLTYWLNIITSLGCLEGGDLDIAYLSEIDPTWTDSSLTTILNPEAVIFANPIAQGACAADAIASAFNMPIDALFWCAGSQGSMYPFNGWVSNESSPLQSSLLVSERMAFKLHRQGMIMETIGKNNAVCNEYPSPILPKERWRYQMVNMYPDSGQCHPFGRSVTRWETGKNPPNTKKNFGYPHVQPDRQYHALLPVYFFLDSRWSGFMGKNKLADVCEWLHLLVVYHAGRYAGFNQVPAGI
ncbi:conjugal transfer protein TraU, partial [Escherichia coli]|nr:conjugal transfer protein TraU [Escherichia coli]